MLDPGAGYRPPGRSVWAPQHHQTAEGFGVYSFFPEPGGYGAPRQLSPYHALLSPHKAVTADTAVGFAHTVTGLPTTAQKSRTPKKRVWEETSRIIKTEATASRSNCACIPATSKRPESGCSRTTPVSLSVVKKDSTLPMSSPCQVAEVTTSVRVKQEAPDPIVTSGTTGSNSIPVGIAVARQRPHDQGRNRDDPPPGIPPIPPPPLLLGCDERSIWPTTQTNLSHWQYPMDQPSVPVGYQLARDPVTGHILLLPTTNVGVMVPCDVGSASKSTAVSAPSVLASTGGATTATSSGLALIQQLALNSAPQFNSGSLFIQHISNTNTVPQQLLSSQSAGSVLISTQQLSSTEAGSMMISNQIPSMSSQLLGQLATAASDGATALITTPSLVINSGQTEGCHSHAQAQIQQHLPASQPQPVLKAEKATEAEQQQPVATPVASQPHSGRKSQATSPVPCLSEGTTDTAVDPAEDHIVQQSASVQDASNQTETPPMSEDEGVTHSQNNNISQNQSDSTTDSQQLSVTQTEPSSHTHTFADDVSELNGLNGLELLSYSIEHFASSTELRPPLKRIKLEHVEDNKEDNVTAERNDTLPKTLLKPKMEDLEAIVKIERNEIELKEERNEIELEEEIEPEQMIVELPTLCSSPLSPTLSDSNPSVSGLSLLLYAVDYEARMGNERIAIDTTVPDNHAESKERTTTKKEKIKLKPVLPLNPTTVFQPISPSPSVCDRKESYIKDAKMKTVKSKSPAIPPKSSSAERREIEKYSDSGKESVSVTHGYRSRESEQEVKRLLASKQTFELYRPLSPCDPAVRDMKTQLAELKKQYRAKQRELSKLTQPQRRSSHNGPDAHSGGSGQSSTKRGPGRPRKNTDDSSSSKSYKSSHFMSDRSHSPDEKDKSMKRHQSLSPKRHSMSDGDLSPPVLEPWSASPQRGDSRIPPVLTPNSTANSTTIKLPLPTVSLSKQNVDHLQESVASSARQQDWPELDSPSKSPPPLSPATSLPSDSAISQSSSSKKRKVGRPKKRVEMKSTSTETIVAKKPRCSKSALVGLLLANKPDPSIPHKIRPKLKAEVKVKAWCDEEEMDLEEDKKPELLKPSHRRTSLPEEMEWSPLSSHSPKASISETVRRKSKSLPGMGGPTRPTHEKVKIRGPAAKRVKKSTSLPVASSSSAPERKFPISFVSGRGLAECNPKMTVEDLTTDKLPCRILILREGLFYAGELSAITAPDIYGVLVDGDRSHRPQIYSQEEVLSEVIKNVRLETEPPIGTRVCAQWSEQKKCLYPGTVVPPSPDPAHRHDGTISVNFDDGDNGRIVLDAIRLLPPDLTITKNDPNPLLTLGKRKRRNSSASCESISKPPPVIEPTIVEMEEPQSEREDEKQVEEPIVEYGEDVDDGEEDEGDFPGEDQVEGEMDVGVENEGPAEEEEEEEAEAEGEVEDEDEDEEECEEQQSEVEMEDEGGKSSDAAIQAGPSSSSPVPRITLDASLLATTEKKRKRLKKKKRQREKEREENESDSGELALKRHKRKHERERDKGRDREKKGKGKLKKKHKHNRKRKHERRHSTSFEEGSSSTTTSLSSASATSGSVADTLRTSGGEDEECFSPPAPADVAMPVASFTVEEQPSPANPYDDERMDDREPSASSPTKPPPSSDQEDSACEMYEGPSTSRGKGRGRGRGRGRGGKGRGGSGGAASDGSGGSRRSSMEMNSNMAPFLPSRQLWSFTGKGYRRPGAKGRGRKEFYKSICRENETITVGDCAVFLSAGPSHRPYIGKIESMWATYMNKMYVKIKWFYHPEEAIGFNPAVLPYPGGLFESPHRDNNELQTISHKCDVIPLDAYRRLLDNEPERLDTVYELNDIYYLVGHYDHVTHEINMYPGVLPPQPEGQSTDSSE